MEAQRRKEEYQYSMNRGKLGKICVILLIFYAGLFSRSQRSRGAACATFMPHSRASIAHDGLAFDSAQKNSICVYAFVFSIAGSKCFVV